MPPSQGQQQQSGNNSSRFRGVGWNKAVSKWRVDVYHDGKKKYVGTFADEVEAARAYDVKARELKGAAAVLNFGEDGQEQRQQQSGSKSSFRGVCWIKSHLKWRVVVCHEGKQKYAGSYADEVEAARAYDAKARELKGDAAELNFPDTDNEGGSSSEEEQRAEEGADAASAAPLFSTNTSGFRGVSQVKRTGRWLVQIRHENKRHYVGIFDDKVEAARAYDAKARELKGDAAVLNFGEDRAQQHQSPKQSKKRKRACAVGLPPRAAAPLHARTPTSKGAKSRSVAPPARPLAACAEALAAASAAVQAPVRERTTRTTKKRATPAEAARRAVAWLESHPERWPKRLKAAEDEAQRKEKAVYKYLGDQLRRSALSEAFAEVLAAASPAVQARVHTHAAV